MYILAIAATEVLIFKKRRKYRLQLLLFRLLPHKMYDHIYDANFTIVNFKYDWQVTQLFQIAEYQKGNSSGVSTADRNQCSLHIALLYFLRSNAVRQKSKPTAFVKRTDRTIIYDVISSTVHVNSSSLRIKRLRAHRYI